MAYLLQVPINGPRGFPDDYTLANHKNDPTTTPVCEQYNDDSNKPVAYWCSELCQKSSSLQGRHGTAGPSHLQTERAKSVEMGYPIHNEIEMTTIEFIEVNEQTYAQSLMVSEGETDTTVGEIHVHQIYNLSLQGYGTVFHNYSSTCTECKWKCIN